MGSAGAVLTNGNVGWMVGVGGGCWENTAVRCCGIRKESHRAATLKSYGDKIASLKWNKLQAGVKNSFTHTLFEQKTKSYRLMGFHWIYCIFSHFASAITVKQSACPFRLTQMWVCLVRFSNCVPEQSNAWLPLSHRLSLVIYSK